MSYFTDSNDLFFFSFQDDEQKEDGRGKKDEKKGPLIDKNIFFIIIYIFLRINFWSTDFNGNIDDEAWRFNIA